MEGIEARIKHKESLAKIMTADEAALLFRDGMMVATSGSTMGFPKATFQALAERIKTQGGLKIDLLCAGPLSCRGGGRPRRGGGDQDADRRDGRREAQGGRQSR